MTTPGRGRECIQKVSCTVGVRWGCSIANSTEPTWRRELNNFLMNYTTMVLEQNHPIWSHLLCFDPKPLSSFLGSLQFCQPPFPLCLTKLLFQGQQKFPFSQTLLTAASYPASLLPRGLSPSNISQYQCWSVSKSVFWEIAPIHPMSYRKSYLLKILLKKV